MLARATQGLYRPGSTFKTVTLAAAIDLGKAPARHDFHRHGQNPVEAGGHVHVDCSTCRPPVTGPATCSR